MLQPSLRWYGGVATSTALNKSQTHTYNAGDFIVYMGFGSDRLMQPQTPSFPGLTFTQRMSAVGFTGYGCLAMWTAPVPSNVTGTFTATATWGGSGGTSWGWHMQLWTGVVAFRDYWQSRGTGIPQFTSATQWEHNSVMCYGNVDWNVVDGAGRWYNPPVPGAVTDTYYTRDNQVTAYGSCFYNLGEPGGLGTWGMGNPGGQKFSQGAIELYGALNPKAYQKNLDGSLTLVDTPNYWNGSTLTPVTYEFT